MKRIGVLGGMSWESSVEYERTMNTAVRERLGSAHSADLLVRSYDFATIEALQKAGDWDTLAALLAEDARVLEAGGAQLLIIATNTMHLVAPQVEAAVTIPLIHIADAVAEAVTAAGLDTVALLGSRYTMELPFLRERLEGHGITVLVPGEPDRTMVNDVIYDELVRGVVSDLSRERYLRAIDTLLETGAQGVIAGCTEIELLIRPQDLDCPLFPTARLHALAAVDAALSKEPR
ncbi:MAG: aspartate/glutamate racemase family protein [Coriobacteriia bacterium]|nr:aspartate/glutamate racemase family protein [Coriobacteriia bacterium]